MNTETASAKCRCRNCNGHIEFDPRSAGQSITCPHCAMDTQLYIPGRARPPVVNGRIASKPDLSNSLSNKTIVAVSISCLLICAAVACAASGEPALIAIAGGCVALALVGINIWAGVYFFQSIEHVKKTLDQIERNTRDQ